MHKKKNPRYGLVRGYIPKKLIKHFKSHCIEKEIDFSQGLEMILEKYFQMEDESESLDLDSPFKERNRGLEDEDSTPQQRNRFNLEAGNLALTQVTKNY
ncbi:MAG: hypothetical protein F6J89_02195 [Symploca sp. SIO1C4]|uniref:Uncharacterized protein n=1 Tax=Symploca sp. SIO1C4 TaxID=2607765 RepID=A0A6B3N749_9CYAN|nr:hypothetical protein [Symploca sp. SIO1C4]